MTGKHKKAITIFFSMIFITLLGGCSPFSDNQTDSSTKPSVDISEIHEKVKQELGENYIPEREVDLEEIEGFTDIDSTDIKEYIAEAPLISTYVNTFIAIEAKEGKGDHIVASLEKYRNYLIEQSFQYPMNIAKVEAAKVVQHGDYIFFLMLEEMDHSMDTNSEEALEFAQNEIQRVKTIIDGFFE